MLPRSGLTQSARQELPEPDAEEIGIVPSIVRFSYARTSVSIQQFRTLTVDFAILVDFIQPLHLRSERTSTLSGQS